MQKTTLVAASTQNAQTPVTGIVETEVGKLIVTATFEGVTHIDWLESDEENPELLGRSMLKQSRPEDSPRQVLESGDAAERSVLQGEAPQGDVSHSQPDSPFETDDEQVMARHWVREASKQLQEYFRRERSSFDVPCVLHGTEFQVAVWNALQEIPYGETRSYGDIARQIGRAKAVRAVGQANRANPIPIVIPCHRVIGSSGKLVGYAGSKVHLKATLLELEQATQPRPNS